MASHRVLRQSAQWVIAHRRPMFAAWLVAVLGFAGFAKTIETKIVPGGEASASSPSQTLAKDDRSPSLFATATWRRSTSDYRRAYDLRQLELRLRDVSGIRAVRLVGLRSSQPTTAVLSLWTLPGDAAIGVARTLARKGNALAADHLAVAFGGFGAYNYEVASLSTSDLARAERIGIPLVFIALLIIFGSFWAALIPLLLALSSVTIGIGVLSLAADTFRISEYATTSATMLGIALGVDYAMFLVHRTRQGMRRGQDAEAAIVEAMGTTGQAVIWSAFVVLLAEASLFLVDSRAVRSSAAAMVLVTFITVVAVVTMLPALLFVLRARIAPRSRAGRPTPEGRLWRAWSVRVTRHPWAWLLMSVGLLAALAVPAISLHRDIGVSAASTLPPGSSVRTAYERGQSVLGPGGISPIVVQLARHADSRPVGTRNEVAEFVSTTKTDAAVRAVQILSEPGDAQTILLNVIPKYGAYDSRTAALLLSLRSGWLRHRLSHISYITGGETASVEDMSHATYGAIPLVVWVVLTVVAISLLLMLRAPVVAIKAIVLVVLSLAASLGGLVVLTQTGVGSHLLGLPGPTRINPLVPLTIVSIVVALSTDYEMVLLGRIAEHRRRRGPQSEDEDPSVREGLAETGSVISGAAAIMIVIFGSFALADLSTLKQLGAGMALAVFLDAFVVRAAVVPAAMELLGRWNWWPWRTEQLRAQLATHPMSGPAHPPEPELVRTP